ncbi:MAG: transcription antitermination factor NusB [Oscillospiraceae bacterium]|nr:transcription antitermination factor NusB [Oscillospiraceae bacterium]
MSRRKAREFVLCLVFEKDYQKDSNCEKLYDYLFEDCDISELYNSFGKNMNNSEKSENEDINQLNSLTKADEEYIKNTFFGIFENIEQIDDIISGSIIGWEYNRISKISMALLRIAVYEILYVDDIPVSVAINEAVELSKRYDYSEAYTFINGVLGAVAKNI